MKKLIYARRGCQVFFLALFVYILWSTAYPLRGFLPSYTFFKIDPLIMIFTSVSERVIIPGIVFAICMLFFTLILGRFFCGWVCPLGTIIDASDSVINKIRRFPKPINKKIYSLKYFILGVIVLFSFLGFQFAWVFDPVVITARFISINLIPVVSSGFDKTLIFLIRYLHFSFLYNFYHWLKYSLLEVHGYYFLHSDTIFIFFLGILLLTCMARRFWCRAVCPLGAIYALIARFAVLGRRVEGCSQCLGCRYNCRMAAIVDGMSYIKGECVLCMDCIYKCSVHRAKFDFSSAAENSDAGKGRGVSRREFMFVVLSSFLSVRFWNGKKVRLEKGGVKNVIRPPAALKEENFLDRCIRCGNCIKVCITNGLQPVIFESGITGIWTPQLVPEIGYCEYNCTLCGNVCPTGAIPRLVLQKKQKVKLGFAYIDHTVCIAWSKNKECIVCEEHCPLPDKAIKLVRDKQDIQIAPKPAVDNRLCIGCGICQNKCPTRPVRAIRVFPIEADRT